MHSVNWIVVILYGLGMLFIFSYSIAQLTLLIRFRKNAKLPIAETPPMQVWPSVLVQLPVYNELYVVERIIDAACNLAYPQHLLEIQLLDDSTDQSFALAAERVAYWQRQGVRIEHVSRPNRTGFKAGALAYGLELSQAEFVAIFDADFVPAPDFLKRTLPHFTHEKIGMVQTRWEHFNRNYSLLTRVQAFALDAHFTVEQVGRNLGHHFINFNGTAGVWRRTCIIDAGGWSADTLTEDLDLSYRAQLKGWQFVFIKHVTAPAELPAEMNALKNQQYRWNKGAAECAIKHLRQVISTASIPLSTKIHALFHLLNSSVFVWIVLCALLSLPLIVIKQSLPEYRFIFHLGGLLMLSFFILAIFYYTAFKSVQIKEPSRTFFWLYPAFLSMSMGLSLHNALAVILGYGGKRTPFIRTPKWSITGKVGTWVNKDYIIRQISPLTWAEGLLAVYFALAMAYGIRVGEWGFLPLHAMLLFGFASVFVYSLRQSWNR